MKNKDKINEIAQLVRDKADVRLVQTMMLDLMAEQNGKIVELESKMKRAEESLHAIARGAKPINSGSFGPGNPGSTGGGNGFSIG